MSNRKPFNEQLYQENDALAKAAAISWLKLTPEVTAIKQNPDQYGVDMLYTYDSNAAELECEVKRVWKGGAFPYDTVQVPQRKAKYFGLGADYLLLAANGKDCLFLSGEDIVASPVAEVPNVYVSQGEYFYQVPLEAAIYHTFDRPITPAEVFCCGEMSLKQQGGVWRCEECGVVDGS